MSKSGPSKSGSTRGIVGKATGLLPHRAGATKTTAKTRRTDVRRTMGRRRNLWRALLLEPAYAYAVAIALVFVIACSALVISTQRQIWEAAGEIAEHTRLVRLDFKIPDKEATENARGDARRGVPLCFLVTGRLDDIRDALKDLPERMAGFESLDDLLDAETRAAFGFDEQGFQALKAHAGNSQAWAASVERLLNRLAQEPILSDDDYSYAMGENGTEKVNLYGRDGRMRDLYRTELTALANVQDDMLTSFVRDARFPSDTVALIVHRLAYNAAPTFKSDEAATRAAQKAAADAVDDRFREHHIDEIIYRRGDVVDEPRLLIAEREQQAYEAQLSQAERVGKRAGMVGLILLITAAMGGYIAYFHLRIFRNPMRIGAIATLMFLMLLLACLLAKSDPHPIHLTAISPALLLAMVLAIVYEQRLAVALTSLFALLVTVSLSQSIGFFTLIVLGAGVATWQLREIRQRNTIMRAGILTAATLGIGTFVIGFLERPIVPGITGQITVDAALAAIGGLLVGLFVLGILPTIERIFDITTGLKLVDLRDSKQPLLRELQQRAPGTFNHSLTLASMGDAAAEAIGADPLLTYVGGLYHDIGKINKPDYFIENQGSGFNRHSKLSPAMSLLVIVGHVKDGLEVAKEFGLPRQVLHFIESHHGTTLVEFFYHAAKEKAAENPETDAPAEVEYRYPGPRPRTKEAAILMLCDCVESATRAMA
ncbi:MAG: HDIG domain-containing protein, partial [Phycisphaerales bacterium]|nr:HDIG domain-containing protein [Phycisphaerales bacterium]